MKKRLLAGILAASFVISLSSFAYSEVTIYRSANINSKVISVNDSKQLKEKVARERAELKKAESELENLVKQYQKAKDKNLGTAKRLLDLTNRLDNTLSREEIDTAELQQIMAQLKMIDDEINRGGNTGGGNGGVATKKSRPLRDGLKLIIKISGEIAELLTGIEVGNGSDPVKPNGANSNDTGWKLLRNECRLEGFKCEGGCEYARGPAMKIYSCTAACQCPPTR